MILDLVPGDFLSNNDKPNYTKFLVLAPIQLFFVHTTGFWSSSGKTIDLMEFRHEYGKVLIGRCTRHLALYPGMKIYRDGEVLDPFNSSGS